MVIERILIRRGYVTLTSMKSAFLMKDPNKLKLKRYSKVTEQVTAF